MATWYVPKQIYMITVSLLLSATSDEVLLSLLPLY